MSQGEQIKKRALRGGAVLIAARFGLQAFQWVTTLVIARLLMPEHYGLMAISAIFVDLAALIAAGGFGAGLVQQRDITRRLEGEAFTLSIAFAATVYTIIWLLAPTIAGHFDQPGFSFFLRVMALVLWLVPLNSICNALLARELRFGSQAAVTMAAAVLQAAVSLVMAWRGYGVWALGTGVLCAATIQAGGSWWLSRWRPAIHWPTSTSIALTKFGATVMATSVFWSLYITADTVIVSILLGPAILGVYSMALQLVRMPVDKVAVSVNAIAYAAYCRMTHEPERLRDWYLQLVTLLMCLTGPVLIGAAVIADDAIPLLLGGHWRDIVVPFQILASVGVLMFVATSLPPLLNALGRPDIPMKYTITCALIYPPAFFVGTKLYGLHGACLVWLVLYPLQTIAFVHFSQSVTGVTLGLLTRRLMPLLVGLVLMSLMVAGTNHLMAAAGPVARIAVGVVCGAIVYCASVLLFGGWRIVEIVRSMIGNQRSPASDGDARSATAAAK